MKNIASLIDHTLLKPSTKKQIVALCREAMQYKFASVCILPDYVKLAKKTLVGSGVKVCTVVGFPLGENTTQTKVFETKNAVKNGAEEIDMVINLSWAKGNEWKKVSKEIAAVVKAAKGALVKVIIETCLLDKKKIVKACLACVEGGAQCVKTSTGFSLCGAKAEDIVLMAETLKGSGLFIKASGGIRDKAAAMAMIEAGAQRLGTSSGVKIVDEGSNV